MAWRIDSQVQRGWIDNRTKGRVTGEIWLVGRDEPLRLDLEGNAAADLAGHLLTFVNPAPEPGGVDDSMPEQQGWTGEITASRKVKVPDCPMEEALRLVRADKDFPWHWANSLYLEWFSRTNGGVVVETADFQLTVSEEPTWIPDEAEEAALREQLGAAMLADAEGWQSEDDEPRTDEEAAAAEDAARMDLLLDRVQARIESEGAENFEKILGEERERLRIERGEDKPEIPPEVRAERQRWMEEATAEVEAERWKENDDTSERHPLVARAMDFSVRLYSDVADWLPENFHSEHPLLEVVNGVSAACTKLGGVLGSDGEMDWPPHRLEAGDALVRLKKARAALHDAAAGLDAAAREKLGTLAWRAATRGEVVEMLGQIEILIAQARTVLLDPDD